MIFRKNILILVFLVMAKNAYAAADKNIRVSMVNSTAIGDILPMDALAGGKWTAVQSAEYVKFHIYLDEAVEIKSVSVNSCKDEFSSDATLYINFDKRVLTMMRSVDKKTLSAALSDTVNARSITINFQGNKNLCFQNLAVFDQNNHQINFTAASVENGEIAASYPTGESYNAMNLFDSRFEYAWSPVPDDRDRSLEFRFKKSVNMTGLKIWNGYQRSDIHCVRNGRAREILVTGDGNFSEKISLEDKMEPQTIKFSRKFSGKNIKLSVVSVYGGQLFAEPVLSELRFLDGDKTFMLNPLEYMQQNRKKNEKVFAGANADNILDKDKSGTTMAKAGSMKRGKVNTPSGVNMRQRPTVDSPVVVLLPNDTEFEIIQENEKKESINGVEGRWIKAANGKNTGWVFDGFIRYLESASENGYSYWVVRLRGDGSLYLDGSENRTLSQGMGETKTIYAIGNYKIIESGANELVLEFFGLKRTTISQYPLGGMDCNGCGRDCNTLGGVQEDGSQESVFIEKMKLKLEGNNYILTSLENKPVLGFHQLKIKKQ